jgi:uncharacterized protein YndB with AHSA1/START domain
MDPEIISSRRLDAPRAAVFGAFTDPDVLARWWGPQGFTNRFDVFDLRPGGAWRFTMCAPDGSEHGMVKSFEEVVPLERIVVRHLEPPQHRFLMTMLFSEEAGGTRLTWQVLFEEPEEAERVRELFLQGNEQNFDRLAAELALLA